MTTSTDIAVVDRATGEVLTVGSEPIERLAAFVTNLKEYRSQLAEAEGIVHGEIVDRLDKEATGTLRCGDPKGDVQWEIKVPSATAGTVSYPAVDLEPELQLLIADDVISEAAAAKALQRGLTVELTVPFDTDKTLEDLASLLLDRGTIEIDGVTVTIGKVTPFRKSSVSGADKVAKVPGAKDAIERAKHTDEPGTRRPTVSLKTKAALR